MLATVLSEMASVTSATVVVGDGVGDVGDGVVGDSGVGVGV